MSMFTRPKVRLSPELGDSSPVEATLESDGRIRVVSDPDSMQLNGAWLEPDEIREWCLDLLGLADASEIIHQGDPEPGHWGWPE